MLQTPITNSLQTCILISKIFSNLWYVIFYKMLILTQRKRIMWGEEKGNWLRCLFSKGANPEKKNLSTLQMSVTVLIIIIISTTSNIITNHPQSLNMDVSIFWKKINISQIVFLRILTLWNISIRVIFLKKSFSVWHIWKMLGYYFREYL